MKFTAFLLVTALAAACAPVSDSARSGAPGVRLLAESPRPGVVRLMLENGSRNAVLYNLCASGLQRQTAAGWEPLATNEVCTMELRTLNPGADATFEKTLPRDIPSGDYRFVTVIESPPGTRKEVTGAHFTIR